MNPFAISRPRTGRRIELPVCRSNAVLGNMRGKHAMNSAGSHREQSTHVRNIASLQHTLGSQRENSNVGGRFLAKPNLVDRTGAL